MHYKSEPLAASFHSFVMTEPDESPTRYMLPDSETRKINWDSEDHLGQMIEPSPPKKKKECTGDGTVDYSLTDHSPAKYPTFNKFRTKRKKTKKKKTKKLKPGRSVQFSPTVTLKTIYHTLKSQTEDIDLAHEEEYPLRVTAFALKRKSQKDLLKYQHQYRPLTPRRRMIEKHIRDTLQRENGNRSSSSQTLTANSIQTSS